MMLNTLVFACWSPRWCSAALPTSGDPMKFTDYLIAPFKWSLLIVAKIVLSLLGLIVVAVALPFKVPGVSVSDGRPIVNLPRWAHIWGNDFDGVYGDKRGWWAVNAPFGVRHTSFLAMYWWTAIRNPANNMRRYSWFAAPISGSVITYAGDFDVQDDPEGGGWQFVLAISPAGKTYHGFYFVHEYGNGRAFFIRVGFKITPSHNGTNEPPKGFTVRINPWKKL